MLAGRGELRVLGGLFDGGIAARPLSAPERLCTKTFLNWMPMRYQPAPACYERPAMNRPPRISFVSLGCPKALVDSERIITRLRAEGYELAREHSGADRCSCDEENSPEEAAESGFMGTHISLTFM